MFSALKSLLYATVHIYDECFCVYTMYRSIYYTLHHEYVISQFKRILNMQWVHLFIYFFIIELDAV